MIPMKSVNEKQARKWMWWFLGALAALQLYFVREILAAFVLFALGFAFLLGVYLIFYLVQQASELSLGWVEAHSRPLARVLRSGWNLVEEVSKKQLRRPRSEPVQ